jgi:aspartyl-tRNA synthetase
VVVRPPGTIQNGGLNEGDSFGDLALVQSAFEDKREWVDVGALDESRVGQRVWVRARLHVVRGKGRTAFLVLRRGFSTVQVVVEEGAFGLTKDAVKFVSKLPSESIVDVLGEVVKAAEEVKSTSQSGVELKAVKVFGVGVGASTLPFQLEDAGRPEPKDAPAAASAAAAAAAPADGKKVQADITVGQEIRLNNRWIDVRTPANHAIFRLQSRVCQYYRNFFIDRDFVEIHTPKLTPGVSEGGAAVFRLKYLNGVNACLAQSPQLYKQMAVMSDLTKVFEIGPVFRAEDSNTNRSEKGENSNTWQMRPLCAVRQVLNVFFLCFVLCCVVQPHVRIRRHGFRDGNQAALPRSVGCVGRLLGARVR